MSVGNVKPFDAAGILYDAQHDLPAPPPDAPRIDYLICSDARTGSTLIGHMLCQSGVMGFPLEYFNTAYMAMMAKRLGAAVLDKLYVDKYMTELRRARTSQNGVF